jgi:hypothetical protein
MELVYLSTFACMEIYALSFKMFFNEWNRFKTNTNSHRNPDLPIWILEILTANQKSNTLPKCLWLPKRNLGLLERKPYAGLGVENLWKPFRIIYGFCCFVTSTSGGIEHKLVKKTMSFCCHWIWLHPTAPLQPPTPTFLIYPTWLPAFLFSVWHVEDLPLVNSRAGCGVNFTKRKKCNPIYSSFFESCGNEFIL